MCPGRFVEVQHRYSGRRADSSPASQPRPWRAMCGTFERSVISCRGLVREHDCCASRQRERTEVPLVRSDVQHMCTPVLGHILTSAEDLDECLPVHREVVAPSKLDSSPGNGESRLPRRTEHQLASVEHANTSTRTSTQLGRSRECLDVVAGDDASRAENSPSNTPCGATHAHLASVASILHSPWVVLSTSMDVVLTARRFWRQRVPEAVRRRVNDLRAGRRRSEWRRPRDLGHLRRTTPFSTWGSSRGGPIDRVYIGEFISRHSKDIRGRALEIADDKYLATYGTGVHEAKILDIFEDNPRATIFADFADAPNVPDGAFDCILVTQVLPFIYDVRAPFRTAHRILAPGGVLLATTPGICRIAPVEAEQFGHWWNFTSMSAKRVAEEVFGEGYVDVESFGNVLAAAGFLFGLGPYDLTREELAVHDPAFEVTIGIRAVKAG
jgi:SAM-dependent methyltransferase